MTECRSIQTTITSPLPEWVNNPNAEGWEIRRKSQPLGIKMTADGFQSDSAAQFAGKRALADFLADLEKEDKRLPRK
jgi:hypothetical protein